MPHVGHAVCCNFGCWHWLHVAVAAGVAFHWLRRERVRERDIFRLGNGTVVLLHKQAVIDATLKPEVFPRAKTFAKSNAKSSAKSSLYSGFQPARPVQRGSTT